MVEPVIVEAAKRNIEKYDVVPLFYAANKAGAEQVTPETMFRGLRRAHDFSGIGLVSNALTKVWNRDEPDWEAAALLCYYNNLVIDGAKTGAVNSYENYPAINHRINRATGGKRGKMPYFFQFSKNGRKLLLSAEECQKKFAAPNRSTMNRICARFDDVGRMSMHMGDLPPFNWEMLMPGPAPAPRAEVIECFCQMDSACVSGMILSSLGQEVQREVSMNFEIMKEAIIHELEKFCTLEEAYVHITRYLFTGESA